MTITEADLRAAVNEQLSSRSTDLEWGFLSGRGYIEEALTSTTEDIDVVARDLADEIRETWPGRDSGIGDAPAMLDAGRSREGVGERTHALSVLLADQAGRERVVIDFRADALGDHLLAADEVRDWLSSRSTARRTWVSTTDSAGVRHTETLGYGIPGDKWMHFVAVPKGGIVERLYRLAGGLAARYGWQQAQATLFILTGAIPLVSPLTAELVSRRPCAGASRLVLTIDPALPPEEVVAEYSRVLRALLGEGKRARPLSEKHLRLGAFVAERQDCRTDAARLHAWNAAYPDWGYKQDQVTNFNRDYHKAQERVLHPDYHPPSGGVAGMLAEQEARAKRRGGRSTAARTPTGQRV